MGGSGGKITQTLEPRGVSLGKTVRTKPYDQYFLATPADENELGGKSVPSDPAPFRGYVFSMSWLHFRKKRVMALSRTPERR
jgi:hypothetical protein